MIDAVTGDMLSGRDVVFLSHQRWHTHVTPVQHIAKRLSRENRVLFIEPPESVGWLLHEPPARRAMRRILHPIEQIDDRLYVVHTPPIFPPWQSRAAWIAHSVTAMYTWIIRGVMRRTGMTDPVFWVFQFSAAGVIQSMRPVLTVYECAEEWSEYGTKPHLKAYIRERDEQLCRCADLVLVPSMAMLERKRPFNENTHLVPWGVRTDLYAAAQSSTTSVPEDIASLPHPVIGMFGMLDGRRLHRELLIHLATNHPDWSIVLIGRCMPNLDQAPLRALDNVHFLGFQPVELLPGYCKAFDVCIIPYMVNEFTRSIMPLKLVEYLATGKPVVATALPAADGFRDVVRVADSIESFESHVLEALAEDAAETEKRLARALPFDWEIVGQRKLELAKAALRQDEQPACEAAGRTELSL